MDPVRPPELVSVLVSILGGVLFAFYQLLSFRGTPELFTPVALGALAMFVLGGLVAVGIRVRRE